jgi:DNA-binding transcriptional regulator YiaG
MTTSVSIFSPMVKIAIEEPNGTKLLQVRSWDLLPKNLFTRSVLRLVYETYLEIERNHGSILNLKPDAIVQKLGERTLAPQTARQCVDFIKGIDWSPTQLPLRRWLKSIRNFIMSNDQSILHSEPANFRSLSHHEFLMPEELLPIIVSLKKWRQANDLSQADAVRVLNEANIAATLDSLQSWEIGRWSPRANVALALADYLRENPKVSKKSAQPLPRKKGK